MPRPRDRSPLRPAFTAWLTWSVVDAVAGPVVTEALIAESASADVLGLGFGGDVLLFALGGFLFWLAFDGSSVARRGLVFMAGLRALLGLGTAGMQLGVMIEYGARAVPLRGVMLVHVALACAGVLVDAFIAWSLTRPLAVDVTDPARRVGTWRPPATADLALVKRARPAPRPRPRARRVRLNGRARADTPPLAPWTDPAPAARARRAAARQRAASWAWAGWLVVTLPFAFALAARVPADAPVNGALLARGLALVLIACTPVTALAAWENARAPDRTHVLALTVAVAASVAGVTAAGVLAVFALAPVAPAFAGLAVAPWALAGVTVHACLADAAWKRARLAGGASASGTPGVA